jgi:hypothetical protein
MCEVERREDSSPGGGQPRGSATKQNRDHSVHASAIGLGKNELRQEGDYVPVLMDGHAPDRTRALEMAALHRPIEAAPMRCTEDGRNNQGDLPAKRFVG